MKTLAAILLAALLVGCTGLPKLGGPTVNTNAQVGQENTQQVVLEQQNNQVDGNQTLSTVSSGSVNRISIEQIPPWVMLLLLLGWMLPSPHEMWNGFKNVLKIIFKRGNVEGA